MAKGKIYLVTLLLVAAAMPVLGATLSTQIREGVYKEEVEGDLDAAIKIYEGIITAHADNHRYASQAMYRLGLCHLKKGQKDKAIEQFERIVKDYSSQKIVTRKSKAQLKKLKPVTSELSERDRIIASSYVIHYMTVGTAEDGLKVFNRSHPKGVRTHHAKRYRVNGETVSSICTDTAADKDKIVSMIENNKQLALVKVEAPKMARPGKPMVIDSFPKTYANDVSVDTDKLTVTFDQPMIKGNFSWVRWNYKFPETTGKPSYDEKGTTCTLGVKLEPGTAYLLRINAKQYSSFMNLKGVRAQPFVLVFATKDKNGKATPIPEDMLKFAKYINGLNPTSNKLAAENLAAEGWKLWGQRKLAEAEGKFKEAIAADAGCENAYQGLGWAQLNQGKRHNAKDSFQKCVKINPKNSAALNGLGWVAHGQGNIDEAIKWWEKAVKAFEGATASLNGLTQAYMQREEYSKAIVYYKMWIKAEPKNQQAKDGLEKAKTQQQKVGAATTYKEFSDEHIAKVVQKAVATVSTCADGDPKIAKSMKTLKPIKPKPVLEELARQMSSTSATKRRSAIYIVWKGEFKDITPAVKKLTELCSHESGLTRGMAALALGEKRIASSFDVLTNMTLNDDNGYARRCGAYALGRLGNIKALETLKKATEDNDQIVKQNAEAAITMLTELKDE